MLRTIISTSLFLFLLSCTNSDSGADQSLENQEVQAPVNELIYEGEKHFSDLKQLTFGGENAEAYWSFGDSLLVLQKTNKEEGLNCDQIFYINTNDEAETPELKRISNGLGRTTCAYFLPGNDKIIYASTHLSGPECPPEPDRSEIKKYVWPIYNTYELFIADINGNLVEQLSNNDFYDAEATVSPKGDKIVFTSNRNGDLDLYTMNMDGSDIRQVTFEKGYDGGAFFSPDGTKLVFRASRFKDDAALKEYEELLKQGLVAPGSMEIFTCNVDGSDLKQITNLGAANWAPFYHPSGEKILFCSNHLTGTFPFNIFMINTDGTGLEQITFDTAFDSFPMFSSDGKKLVFSSNRNNGGTRETNVFVADWVD